MSWVLMELALLGGPLFGFLASRRVSYQLRTLLRLVILGAGVCLWALDALGLRFAPPMQILPLTLLILGIWMVVGLSRPPQQSGRARKLFFWIPASVLIAASGLLGSVGALGVGMAMAPHDEAIHEVHAPTRTAYITYLGGATLDRRAFRVELRRRLPVLGMLEWAVAARTFSSDALGPDLPPQIELFELRGRPAARVGFPEGGAVLPGPDTLSW